jgi:hypothetical protein
MKPFLKYLVERHDGDGDCMSAAANLMMRFYSDFFGKRLKATGSPVLVHALVYGQGAAKGLRFPHAWVEDADTVIDQSNGRDIRMDKRVYYAIGGIKPKEKGAYVKYSYPDMKKKLLSTRHYGPWDLDERLEESAAIDDKRKIGKRKKRVSQELLSMLKEGIVTDRPTTGAYARAGTGAVKVTWNDLKRLESVLDNLFASAKLDVAFTRHFHERINGSRGYGGTVSLPEVQDAFRKTYAKYAPKIASHPVDWKAVINDVSKDLNMPFALEWDGNKKSMVMVTAMKKRDFKTPDPKLPV